MSQQAQNAGPVGYLAHHYREDSPADARLHAHDRPHPREEALAWATLVVGVVSFGLACAGGFMLGLVLGVVGAVLGLYSQLVSATTAERWVILPGLALSALGIGLNMFFMWP
jgi:hypothetical protein